MDTVNVGSFNTRSLTSSFRKDQIISDCIKYNLDVLCVQETKLKHGADNNIRGFRLLCFPSDSPYYGSGFLISKSWNGLLFKTWKVSDRICVAQFRLKRAQGKDTFVSIINTYAPTSERAKKHPEDLDQFYEDLNKTLKEIGNRNIVILAGDFNSKVGKREEGDTCLGSYSKGIRNSNGERLAEFCEDNNLFITNSAFCHPSRHRTTWTGNIRDKTTGSLRTIYNQIDYIICQKRHKHIITNSRSYGGTLLTSDHKLVKTNFRLGLHIIWGNKSTNNNTSKINISNIVNSSKCRKQYCRQLDTLIIQQSRGSHTEDPDVLWNNTQHSITNAAVKSAGAVTHKQTRRTHDSVITEMSTKQKDLRIQIQNTKKEEERKHLKQERNRILHQIRERALKLKNEELDKQVENINSASNDQAMFKAVKLLYRKPYENPTIADSSGKLITDPDDMLTALSNHFSGKFKEETIPAIISFEGEPRPLLRPITPSEVRTGFNSLSNNKAPGEDQICAELLKYGPPSLDEEVAVIFNLTFKNHSPLNINSGVLIPIQKPGKPKGPLQNLRPITLLNTIRKTLSIITLNRIRPYVENYLSPSQSGFRLDRSTADVVWTHKWLAAKTLTEKVKFVITGIDMSAAFDTINRHELLEIMKRIILPDDLRLVRFLLSETWVNTRVHGASVQKPFLSNKGTPQGDSLSPVLFVVYMEHALREVRNILPTPQSALEIHMPSEIAYADDVDFITTDTIDITPIKETLQKHNLFVNVEKTDITILTKGEETWKLTKKVGSLIGDKEDVNRRKQLSTAALHKLTKVWIRKDKLKRTTKIKLYKSLVKSVLIYNCGTWALTQREEDQLDTFHRKQLRKVLNIHYPTKITNKSLYEKCNETILSTQILETRWKLLGHILRRDKNIPANKAMTSFFTPSGENKYRGRPSTNIQTILNRDLKRLGQHHELKSEKDLAALTTLATDRTKWRKFTKEIREAAEASQSVD